MNRADHGLSGTIVPDRLACRAYATGNTRVRDSLTLPDRGNDFVLRDHVITVLNEMDKQRKDLRLEPHRLVAATELESPRVESKVTE